ncbi:LamG domain-containing protein [Streptomyces sp. NPDC000410]|uniref:LamG domain-containing protein n=1 Tax=Streptomyces sp. NPDC000410 TaxID=3154254 RepID=UPI00331A322D
MTRRWSLIGLIVGLAIALTVVLVTMGGGGDDGAEAKQAPAADAKDKGKKPNMKGVAWWPMDEKSGTIAADAAGNHDATLQGGAIFGSAAQGIAPQKGGNALYLNGQSQYAAVVGSKVLNTNGDYSVAARVRLDNKGFRTAVSIDGTKHSVFYLQYTNTEKRFAFSFINQRALANTVGDPQLGRWYHLVGTYSAASGTLSIYVDGALSGNALARNIERPAGNLVIGRGKFDGKPVDFWSGGITDVHAYNRALSPADVASLAKGEPAA